MRWRCCSQQVHAAQFALWGKAGGCWERQGALGSVPALLLLPAGPLLSLVLHVRSFYCDPLTPCNLNSILARLHCATKGSFRGGCAFLLPKSWVELTTTTELGGHIFAPPSLEPGMHCWNSGLCLGMQQPALCPCCSAACACCDEPVGLAHMC